MLSKFVEGKFFKSRAPRLHRLLKEEDTDRFHKRVADIATDEHVAAIDKFERNAIHVAVRHVGLETVCVLACVGPSQRLICHCCFPSAPTQKLLWKPWKFYWKCTQTDLKSKTDRDGFLSTSLLHIKRERGFCSI